MISSFGVLASAVLVFAAASQFVAITVAASYPAARRSLGGLPPAARAGLLLALACTPALVGLAFLTFALWPSLTHLLGLAIDHCHSHGHHAHFCLAHAPWWTGRVLEGLVLLGAGLGAVSLLAGVALRLWRVGGVARAFRTTQSAHAPSRLYRVVDSHIPLALTVGLIRPRIYLSSRLLEVLSPAELSVVVAHERAHRHRRDALSLLIADVLSRLHLPWIRSRLLADLRLATEQACDEEAARATGDRLGVAKAILTVTRLGGERPLRSHALLVTITGADIQVRVGALLHPAPTPKSWPQGLVAAGTGLLAALGWVFADRLHHAVESALHLLFG